MREREHFIGVWLGDRELAHLHEQCAITGLSTSAFVRQAIAGIQLRPRPPDAYAALLRELAAKNENPEVVHIISNSNYAAQLNAVLEAMGYGLPTAARETQYAKKAKPRAPQEKSSGERGTGWRSTGSNERPSVREKLENLKTAAETINAPQRSRGKDKAR